MPEPSEPAAKYPVDSFGADWYVLKPDGNKVDEGSAGNSSSSKS